jgi:Tol biopolymer transport system component
MPDLDTRFRSFGRVRAPELWPEIERREPSPPPGPPLRPRIVSGVVALLVAAAGFAFAERAFSGGARQVEHQPASAPISNRIAFSAYRDGTWNIFSVNPDGSDLRSLTDLPTDEFAPAFSPDGSQIAFVAQRSGSAADADLFVMNVDGSGLTRLTSTGTNWDPTWSPDGTQIAFRKAIDGDEEIYVVGADGSGETDLSRSPSTWELDPSWSPDGTRIAFTSVRGNDQGPQIYVMNADGTGVQRLTDSADPHGSPEWSPDGTRIAFATQKNGVWGVDVMNADGSGVQRIAETPGRGASPSWSPDGTQIAYETGSVNADFAELNVVNADGSGAHAITDHQFSDLCCASWAGTSSSSSPTTTRQAWTPHPRLAAEIPIPDGFVSGGIVASDGTTWVGAQPEHSSADPQLLRIDQATNSVVASIPLPAPISRHEIAAGAGAIWVASSGLLRQIDPATNSVAASVQLPGNSIGAIAADDSAIWVEVLQDRAATGQNDLAILVRVDPVTKQIVAQIPLGTLLTGYEDHVVIGAGSVWLLGAKLINNNTEDGGDLVRVDPSTNQVVATIPVDGFGLGVGTDAVWVTAPADGLWDSNSERWVTLRVDPLTNQVSTPMEPEVSGIVAVTADGIWTVDYDQQERAVVSLVDPKTLHLDVEGPQIPSYFTDATFDGSSRTIWISGVRSVYRVDLA